MTPSITIVIFTYITAVLALGVSYVFAPTRVAKGVSILLLVIVMAMLGHASNFWVLP